MAPGFTNVEKVRIPSRFMVAGELVVIGWLAFRVTLTKLWLEMSPTRTRRGPLHRLSWLRPSAVLHPLITKQTNRRSHAVT